MNCQYQLGKYMHCNNIDNRISADSFKSQISIPQTIIKKCLKIIPKQIPHQIKHSLIQKLLLNQFFSKLSENNSIQNNFNDKNKTKKTYFNKEEDEKIKHLVKIFGTHNWEFIAHFMEGRTSKQCRDRYSNYLIPGFSKREWTIEEDELLIKLYNNNGSRWSVIQKSFPNRSQNSIKNRWNYLLRINNKTISKKKIINHEKTEQVNITERTNTMEKNRSSNVLNEVPNRNIENLNEPVFDLFNTDIIDEDNFLIFNDNDEPF